MFDTFWIAITLYLLLYVGFLIIYNKIILPKVNKRFDNMVSDLRNDINDLSEKIEKELEKYDT